MRALSLSFSLSLSLSLSHTHSLSLFLSLSLSLTHAHTHTHTRTHTHTHIGARAVQSRQVEEKDFEVHQLKAHVARLEDALKLVRDEHAPCQVFAPCAYACV